MPTPILMPALSPTMEEGTLAKWNVKEGDKVSSGDIIAEIETDKATMEVEAVDEGTVGKILIDEGSEGVKVNALIAVLLDDGESAGDIDEAALAGGAAPASSVTEPEKPAGAVSAAPAVQSASAPASQAASSANGRVLASPLAKRLAQQEGLDLSAVKGSGPRGRVVKRDIEQALKDGTGKAGSAAAAPQIAPASVDARLYPPESYEAVKLDGMRKVIAKRLTQSFNQEVPHFPLNVNVELDTLLAARARINATSPKEGDGVFKLSVNDFILKASAMALKAVPAANATFTDEAILLHKHADIGVAVGLQNHPSTGDDILRILAETDRPNFSFLLDTGQWVGSPAANKGQVDPAHDIYRYMEQTAQYATHVRAKFYKIDSGSEEWIDYSRIVPILRDAGFNGALSVVFEGKDANACGDKEVIRLAVEQLRRLAG